MVPHSTSVDVLPSHAFHTMGFTTKFVVVLRGFTEASLEESELPHAETVRASVAAIARGRNVIAPAYESPCV
jgi:hypothetical protein